MTLCASRLAGKVARPTTRPAWAHPLRRLQLTWHLHTVTGHFLSVSFWFQGGCLLGSIYLSDLIRSYVPYPPLTLAAQLWGLLTSQVKRIRESFVKPNRGSREFNQFMWEVEKKSKKNDGHERRLTSGQTSEPNPSQLNLSAKRPKGTKRALTKFLPFSACDIWPLFRKLSSQGLNTSADWPLRLADLQGCKNKATAPLATPSNSVIFHDAWCTESWYLQGFVKTW